MQKLVKNMIEEINQLYATRDIELLRIKYDSLFDEDAILIGTSPNEVCLDQDSIIKLFQNDFEGWGDFHILQESMKSKETGDFLFVSFDATLKVEFKSNPNVFNVFSHVIKENDEFIENKKTAALKNIWLLQHILKNRNADSRSYLWSFKFHLVLSKLSKKIKLIHFAYPFETDFYDVLLGIDPYDDQMFEKELNRFDVQVPEVVKNEMDNLSKETNKSFQLLKMNEISSDNEHLFIGVGTLSYEFDYDAFYQRIMERAPQDEDMLFHTHRDLAYGLMLDSLNPIKTSFRIVGVRNDQEILHSLITYPYQIILENKNHKEKVL